MKHTEASAQAEAFKRNKHKSKHQTNVTWQAVHDSVNGWQCKLVPVPAAVVPEPTLSPELMALGRAIEMFGPAATFAALNLLNKQRGGKE